ncbi:MAG: ABC transporter ATP-binding protein [Candidatus Thermoplasmatota archaeon]|jgi:ABC-2 type transport system ATP-binding protein
MEIGLEAAAQEPFAIDARGLTKHYGAVPAVTNLHVQVRRGAIFGFLGHNGAGKTTTVNMLTTLLSATSGSARVAGFDIATEHLEVRKRIGYLPENLQMYESLTAYENLDYLARLSGLKAPKTRILEVLKFLDATSFKDKKMGKCSKGMRQKIGIAQAILHRPEVLFLDEPTSGLDPFGVKQLRDTIIDLNKATGMTIFMNTHLLSEVAQTCSQLGVLSHGRLIYTDSLTNTLKRFKDEESLEEIYLSIHATKG